MSFAGAANTTYTATGIHRGIATLWDYDYDPPYQRIYYYDNWFFTPFEGQNVYNPWQYFFLSPGYRNYTRRTSRINLGTTYDSDSTNVIATTCLVTYNKYFNRGVDTGGGDHGQVNMVDSLAVVLSKIKSSSDATVINADRVSDGKNNVYQKYPESSSEIFRGRNINTIGTISISSGPDSLKKLRFTKY